MDFEEVETWQKVSERIEDDFPEVQEKKGFEKHINAYFDKIRRCHTYWSILQEMKFRNNDFKLSFKYAPAFWSAIHYNLQMGLVTELVSLISNDEASLATYFSKILIHKNRIFTRKFIITWKNAHTNELIEKEWHNRYSNDEAIAMCNERLNKAISYLAILKKARDKVYCHFDKLVLDVEKCNIEVFNNISDSIVNEILDHLSFVIITLDALYTNISKQPYYENKNDIKSIFTVIKTYDKYQNDIMLLELADLHKKG